MDQSKARKRLSREEKLRDQKIEEEVMKVVDDGKNPEDKLQLLIKHCIDRERTNRRLIVDLKYQFKQLESVEREKDNLQKDCSRNVLMRDKLTEVCREQQKIIKSLKNESTQKIREEEEKRKELQSKFNDCLGEITQSLTKNNEENVKLQALNMEMNQKLKTLFEQYNVREQQLEKLGEQMQLESQLHQAKVNKLQVESVMEREVLMKEKELALEQLLHAQKVVKEMFEREVALKEQLHLFTEKYDDIKDALGKSNDIFVKYKHEMEEMTKYIRKMEKDASVWRRKWEQGNATIISMAAEKMERDEQTLRHKRQIDQLRKLLRALQNERIHLYAVLRDHNIEVPTVPPQVGNDAEPDVDTLPPASQSPPEGGSGSSGTMNRKSYVELKKTLASLQQQMKQISSNQLVEEVEADEGAATTSGSVSAAPASSNCKMMMAAKKLKKKDKKKSSSVCCSSIAAVNNGDMTKDGEENNLSNIDHVLNLENNCGQESKRKGKKSKIKAKVKSNLTNGGSCEESLTSAPADDESNPSDNDAGVISMKSEEEPSGGADGGEGKSSPLFEDAELLEEDNLLSSTETVENLEKRNCSISSEMEKDIQLEETQSVVQEIEVLATHLAESCLEEQVEEALQSNENLEKKSTLKISSIGLTNVI